MNPLVVASILAGWTLAFAIVYQAPTLAAAPACPPAAVCG